MISHRPLKCANTIIIDQGEENGMGDVMRPNCQHDFNLHIYLNLPNGKEIPFEVLKIYLLNKERLAHCNGCFVHRRFVHKMLNCNYRLYSNVFALLQKSISMVWPRVCSISNGEKNEY